MTWGHCHLDCLYLNLPLQQVRLYYPLVEHIFHSELVETLVFKYWITLIFNLFYLFFGYFGNRVATFGLFVEPHVLLWFPAAGPRELSLYLILLIFCQLNKSILNFPISNLSTATKFCPQLCPFCLKLKLTNIFF